MAQTIEKAAFSEHLTAQAARVEAALERLLQPAALPGEAGRPAELLEAMRYACLGGGKRLRPFLALETAALFGADGPGALRAAAALEMVHCYSLVHDDLPAMDDDDLRRGRPTVHKAFNEAVAILAGDGLLTYAFDVLADPSTHADPAIRARLVLGLARASGLGGMVGGQALDLEAERSSAPLPAEAIRRMQAMKTGALLRHAVEAGAVIGGADAAQMAALLDYGGHLGAAFQIADDILDATGDAQKLGKRANKDADRNKATLVQIMGLAQARESCDREVASALAALRRASLPGAAERLEQAANFVANRDT